MEGMKSYKRNIRSEGWLRAAASKERVLTNGSAPFLKGLICTNLLNAEYDYIFI
jgi:hypothetical protein